MRLLLLPISTRRTLIYCQRLKTAATEQSTYLDKATNKAAALWTSWEKKESGWQKKVVDGGNRLLRRIPYEEWGLKSIPPLSASQLNGSTENQKRIEVSFPPAIIPEAKVSEVLRALGTDREEHHKKRIFYCIIGMPIVAPFALVPVIPNLPFFYLVYRAWSHWRAYSGSKHIQFLLNRNLIHPSPSPVLDNLYSAGIMKAVLDGTLRSPEPLSQEIEAKVKPSSDSSDETLVLGRSEATTIAKALEVPELEIELDRAIEQVEKSLKAKEELKEEKEELDRAAKEAKSSGKEQEKR